MNTPWLEELKVAIIEEHHDKISQLTQEIPPLTQEEAIQANNMIKETIVLFTSNKNDIQKTMSKIKKNAAFLSQEKKRPRLSTLS